MSPARRRAGAPHRRFSLLALCALLASLATATITSQAAADATAPTVSSIGTFLPQFLHAHGDGSVTGSYCDTGNHTATYLKTFRPDGTVVQEATRQPDGSGTSDWFPANCDLTGMTAGTDGTMFVVLRQFTENYATLSTELVALGAGGQIWARKFAVCGRTGDGDLYYPTLGYDNTLYVFVTASGCGVSQQKLVALRADTGDDKWSIPLDRPYAGQGVQYPHVFPIAGGGVSFLDGTTVKVANNAGQVDASKTHDLSTGSQQVIQAAGTASGQVYAQLAPDSTPSTVNGQTCLGDTEVVTQYATTNLRRMPIDDCTFKTNRLASTPDGGVVLIGGGGTSADAFDDRLIRYDGSGAETYPAGGLDLNQLAGFSSIKTDFPLVDGAGDVVVKATGTQDATGDQHVIVSKIDAAGRRTILYSTSAQGVASNGARIIFRSSAMELTASGVYLAICGPSPYSAPSCVEGDSMSLVLVHDPSVGFAYPKSALYAPPVAGPGKCGDAAVVGVRGSGIQDSGQDYPGQQAVEVASLLRGQYKLKLFDNDSNPTDGAIGVAYTNVAIFSPEVVAYRQSVAQGVANLLQVISATRGYCGQSFPIVLVGYSQGAQVVQEALDALNREASSGSGRWQSVVGAVLFASPKFASNDVVARGTFAAQYGLNGVAAPSSVASRFAGIVRSYCLAGDPVCLFSAANLLTGISLHKTSYALGSKGGPLLADAAGMLGWRIKATAGVAVPAVPVGGLAVYRVAGEPGVLRLSGAEVNANGAPSISFVWSFDARSVSYQKTADPTIAHRYGFPSGTDRALQVHSSVRIEFADGSQRVYSVCIRRVPAGSTTC